MFNNTIQIFCHFGLSLKPKNSFNGILKTLKLYLFNSLKLQCQISEGDIFLMKAKKINTTFPFLYKDIKYQTHAYTISLSLFACQTPMWLCIRILTLSLLSCHIIPTSNLYHSLSLNINIFLEVNRHQNLMVNCTLISFSCFN